MANRGATADLGAAGGATDTENAARREKAPDHLRDRLCGYSRCASGAGDQRPSARRYPCN
eukprot:CAMPEP_0167773342 /NCGR_PEP_ID=MMETSP0111_2-20121227/1365_1 /TAXON_ID=91324 /ORGANISM="Lotharella globosa, Strain CCCM811" /LENGTH=59 /DNA_ID=CAMNT_0007662965 /DNA_START=214 /DNA_END=393 /DNA_ORIENTATION=-